jgi:hypothetical protein
MKQVANLRRFRMGQPPGRVFRLIDETLLAVDLHHPAYVAYARNHGVEFLFVSDHRFTLCHGLKSMSS